MSYRKPETIPYKKILLPNKVIGNIEIYYALFILYIIGYGSLQYALAISIKDRFYDRNRQTVVYLFTYSMFVFFLILKAAVTYSVYEYYVAIFILLEKLVVITDVILQKNVLNNNLELGILIAICTLNYLEFFYLVANLFVKRNEIRLYLFKLTGVAPSVNNAFAIRKMLGVFGYVSGFISFFFFYAFTLHTGDSSSLRHTSLRLFYLVIFLITCIFMYVRNEKERVWQRLIAIALNILSILYLVFYTIYIEIYLKDSNNNNQ
ncbi:hypothetical protein PAEPH01_1791 [Pancytospora epiphaga]|nr:hypothetical protein PAEPH01_1791 [Pancytospora epiphaga]